MYWSLCAVVAVVRSTSRSISSSRRPFSRSMLSRYQSLLCVADIGPKLSPWLRGDVQILPRIVTEIEVQPQFGVQADLPGVVAAVLHHVHHDGRAAFLEALHVPLSRELLFA